ncbi:phage baseplate assembly protein V [Acetobacter senegalensis]|uniref:phage baseplate assembly protein V n=1 Tax=Acetobacter senegalensis TaxID=446692 RepID=UPI00264DD8B9|nr:phage baseplate assembly protein V [Acetobacter senegalensis]MDN7351756.1 phage baseplate assembly protein V [Acetobacter senegalensis]
MSRSVRDLYMSLRGLFTRAVVQDLDDSGGNQTVTLTSHYGRTRSKVPVHQPFGFSSHVPHDGAVTAVVAAGGDHSDPIALPPSNPSAARMGNLAEGEAVLYDAVGQKLYLKDGRIVQVDAVEQLDVRIAGKSVLTVDKDGVAVVGTLTVSKDIVARGDVTADGTVTGKEDVVGNGISLHDHTHTSAAAGSPTSPPK